MKRLTILLMIIMMALPVHAQLVLDNIQFDPAVIAAGDDVDVVIQYHVEQLATAGVQLSDPAYRFKVELQADDALSEKYLRIDDPLGDALYGSLFSGGNYNKRFRLKIMNDAPAGSYQLKLTGQWYKDSVVVGSKMQEKFYIDVKREGIVLDVANINTVPSDVRPGDEYVEIRLNLENTGHKDAKAVELMLNLPEEFEHSYSDANRKWIGLLQAGDSKEVTLFVDVDESAGPGIYNVQYALNYMDLDDNSYETRHTLPLLIKDRPYLVVISTEGHAPLGGSGTLFVTVKNEGTESAEAVDVRIIKQSAQPFTIDVRSEYLGELEPGEERTAQFEIGVLRSATEREHSFQLVIRSTGDSDEGDDSVYTYSREANFTVDGTAPNWLARIGIGLVLIVLGVIIFKRYRK